MKKYSSFSYKYRLSAYVNVPKAAINYLSEDVTCDFEFGPLEKPDREGQVMTYNHDGFWECTDMVRDVEHLNKLWEAMKAAWKVWD